MNDVEERTQLVDSMQLTSQCTGEIEAESVDVHLLHPVPQAVHDELQDARAAHIECVAAAGEILVEARLVGEEAVVGRVVDPAQRQGRSKMIAFRGVVVDDIEDDFELRGVQRPHHHLEFTDGVQG